jgi:predicted nucleic acid-binding protein
MTAVDTNILIYAYDRSSPLRRAAIKKLLEQLSDGVLLWQVACEFIAASRKLAPQGMSSMKAWAYLAAHLAVFPLKIPSPSVLVRAQDLHVLSGISFWDAMLYAACLEAGVDTLYSEDLPGCPVPGLKIVNPFG